MLRQNLQKTYASCPEQSSARKREEHQVIPWSNPMNLNVSSWQLDVRKSFPGLGQVKRKKPQVKRSLSWPPCTSMIWPFLDICGLPSTCSSQSWSWWHRFHQPSPPVVQLETITCDCLGVALHGCEPGKAELAVPEWVVHDINIIFHRDVEEANLESWSFVLALLSMVHYMST